MKNKIFKKKFILVFVLLFASTTNYSQTNTYILIRHAEKDTTQIGSTQMTANPNLNAQGIKRSKKLINALKSFAIDTIYSTNFNRTTATVTPISQKRNIEIKFYNHKQLEGFATQLKKYDNKTVLIVGHSNSTPALLNLLIDKEMYKALDESIYNKIFIVKIINGVALVEEREF
jgi:broad specificity phosphatase PhoE